MTSARWRASREPKACAVSADVFTPSIRMYSIMTCGLCSAVQGLCWDHLAASSCREIASKLDKKGFGLKRSFAVAGCSSEQLILERHFAANQSSDSSDKKIADLVARQGTIFIHLAEDMKFTRGSQLKLHSRRCLSSSASRRSASSWLLVALGTIVLRRS